MKYWGNFTNSKKRTKRWYHRPWKTWINKKKGPYSEKTVIRPNSSSFFSSGV
jgi:hypothetical protein